MLLGPRLWLVPAKTEQKDADLHAQLRPANAQNAFSPEIANSAKTAAIAQRPHRPESEAWEKSLVFREVMEPPSGLEPETC
jgi:hypothetical protein